MGIFGGNRRSAPHQVATLTVGVHEIDGTPQYVSIKASGGAAEVLFNAQGVTAAVGDGWIISEDETVDWLVGDSRRFLQVLSGTVRLANS